jgi:hypothetical protein
LQRITIAEILEDEWFKKDYKPPQFEQNEDVSLEDVDAAFNSSEVIHVNVVSWYAICCTRNFIVSKVTYFN